MKKTIVLVLVNTLFVLLLCLLAWSGNSTITYLRVYITRSINFDQLRLLTSQGFTANAISEGRGDVIQIEIRQPFSRSCGDYFDAQFVGTKGGDSLSTIRELFDVYKINGGYGCTPFVVESEDRIE